ncbi:MAG: hypothetical protein LUC30_09225 [Clostridiales bacterium]|nr:hypothetical protein [Clostridiales bacterium]
MIRNFFDRVGNFFSRLMYGRYGSDQLNLVLVIASLVVWLISCFVQVTAVSTILWIISYAGLIYAIFRMCSRNYTKRRAENDWFMARVNPLVQGFQRKRAQMRDKDHVYFKCPSCGQVLRVPKGKKKISITCRNCGNVFQKKT